MSEPKLREWTGEIKRFRPSAYICPSCQKTALEDHWPPNYGGGYGCFEYIESHGSVKCVCVPCRVAFRVSFIVKQEYDAEIYSWRQTERTVTYSETVPLVERDGFLLTPHDVQREEYKEKHGEYPVEVYG